MPVRRLFLSRSNQESVSEIGFDYSTIKIPLSGVIPERYFFIPISLGIALFQDFGCQCTELWAIPLPYPIHCGHLLRFPGSLTLQLSLAFPDGHDTTRFVGRMKKTNILKVWHNPVLFKNLIYERNVLLSTIKQDAILSSIHHNALIILYEPMYHIVIRYPKYDNALYVLFIVRPVVVVIALLRFT